ncbi:hypothetical protein HPP92_015170 [Vanilla planifolia]|uniref:Mitochondrial carrier protein n=1 Tax=Vanilla planifolia TaxID=51239 RepID=A0A835QRJ6_VANPL|nr:hypothetical protein HPP92_015170 [Vanilla planifolia]
MTMESQFRPLKHGKSSITRWWIPLEGQCFEPDATVLKNNRCATSSSFSKDGFTSGESNNRITLSHVRSAAGGIWDCVGQPAVYQAKDNFKCNRENILSWVERERYFPAAGDCTNSICKDAVYKTTFSSTAKTNFDDVRKIKRMLMFASCNCNNNSLFSQFTPILPTQGSIVNELAGMEVSNYTEGKAGSLSTKPYFVLHDLVKFTISASKDERCTIGEGSSIDESSKIQENLGKSETRDAISNKEEEVNKNEQNYPSFLCSTDKQPSTITKEETICIKKQTSEFHDGFSIGFNSSNLDSIEKCQKSVDSNRMVGESLIESSAGKSEKFFGTLSLAEGFPAKPWLAIPHKLQHVFTCNRHAIAGALAGTLVTLCLHPVDTVKTIIQANGSGQMSFHHVLRRIISQNGVLGLYRGIATNIASSAPISAIYTFTYESVKGSLLPILPKEYHSFAHCIAGGCSSIATSFVFTPSERIKQQMQVGSQYQNCWRTLIGCLQNGGLPSLYAGWGAVLCRNIPHSIIKFYTYESLKQFLSSRHMDSNFKNFHTLICGGLAGSTAALFTTPFDVVKTRLQTQAPGSIGKYHGVFHALEEIARQEGLQGLYRGLTPRLAMYVSQGAIFFASYEFLKAVFLLEVPANTAMEKIEDIDDPTAVEPKGAAEENIMH